MYKSSIRNVNASDKLPLLYKKMRADYRTFYNHLIHLHFISIPYVASLSMRQAMHILSTHRVDPTFRVFGSLEKKGVRDKN